MIPRFELRLFNGTILTFLWQMNMLVMSQYQPKLSCITTVASGRSANQIAVFTSNYIIVN
jgi:hypothetical protein